jgi:4-aminobutyrate aminotransferase
MDAIAPGGLGSTYAGNPLAVAAAHAVLDIFAEEPLLERGNTLATRLVQRLEAAKSRTPSIHEVRALGAMVAVEFRTAQGTPSAEAAQVVRQAALDAGLILLTCGQYGNVIRFLFPLTTSDAIFDEALGILDDALAAAEGALR